MAELRRRRGPRLLRKGAQRQRPMNETRSMPIVRGAVNRRSFAARLRRDWPFLVMALPAAALLFVFHYVPTLGNVIAFQDYNPFEGDDPLEAFVKSDWIAFENFFVLF